MELLVRARGDEFTLRMVASMFDDHPDFYDGWRI
jgi:hypothetical protein